jgi:hypothetical protein
VYVAKFVGLRSSRMVIPFDQASTTSELHYSNHAGTTLVVGVNNDESITVCKGKPVTSEVKQKSFEQCSAHDSGDFWRRHCMLLATLNILQNLTSDLRILGGEDGNSSGLQMGR